MTLYIFFETIICFDVYFTFIMRLKDKLSMSDQSVYLLKATTYKVHYCVSQNIRLYTLNIFFHHFKDEWIYWCSLENGGLRSNSVISIIKKLTNISTWNGIFEITSPILCNIHMRCSSSVFCRFCGFLIGFPVHWAYTCNALQL